jgi:hypothetical protein
VINNADKNAIKIEGMIQRTRNNCEITPEFAMEILSLTNHRSNIKKLVSSIKDKCVIKKDILPYKEFVLSCVDRREVEGEAFDNLREMAKVCECEEEFDKANGKPKLYNKFDCEVVTIESIEEFKRLRGENLKIYIDSDNVDLKFCDFSKIKEIKFRDGARVDLTHSICLPEILDFSQCDAVNLSECNLISVKEIKFKDGVKEVSFEKAYNIPKNLDVSMCKSVCLSHCKIDHIENLRFGEGADINLYNVYPLPENLDFSMCNQVNLDHCYLTGVKAIRFKDKKQQNRSKVVISRNHTGEIIYAKEDEKVGSVFNLGKEI